MMIPLNRIVSGPFQIHTNAPVDYTFYQDDRDGAAVAIPAGSYKAQVKDNRNDASPVLEFRSGGGSGLGTLTRSMATIDGVSRDVLQFSSTRVLVADILPGAYYADILRLDTPAYVAEMYVEVFIGITDPSGSIIPPLPYGAVTARQYRLALAAQGKLHLVIQAIPADSDDPANIHWNTGYFVVLGDPVTTVTQAALGYSDQQMIDLILLAETF